MGVSEFKKEAEVLLVQWLKVLLGRGKLERGEDHKVHVFRIHK